MEFLADYGLFLLKSITILVVIFIIISLIVNAGQRQRSNSKGDIRVTNLGDDFKEYKQIIQNEVLSKAEFKQLLKQEKEQDKKQAKDDKQKVKAAKKTDKNQSNSKDLDEQEPNEEKSRLYVLDFDGDVAASEVESLREEISAILSTADEQDRVLVRLESPGGMVHSYGLAASQLQRIRDAGHHLTISVDNVAASGGYMMACVADQIVAAPFSIIGSIGVVAEIPNFNKLLKKAYVDYEQHTAGDYKRTLTMFGENTTVAREKFKQELEDTHQLFKAFIKQNRPQLDIEKVATGEHWYGKQALELGLIDDIKTSDDLIIEALKEREAYSIKYDIKKPLTDKLSLSLQSGLDRFVSKWIQRSSQSNLLK